MKTYSSKKNAVRAAKQALSIAGAFDPTQGEDFTVSENDGKWNYQLAGSWAVAPAEVPSATDPMELPDCLKRTPKVNAAAAADAAEAADKTTGNGGRKWVMPKVTSRPKTEKTLPFEREGSTAAVLLNCCVGAGATAVDIKAVKPAAVSAIWGDLQRMAKSHPDHIAKVERIKRDGKTIYRIFPTPAYAKKRKAAEAP